jgi:anti-sigma factor RsiW
VSGERIEDAELNALVDGELDTARQAEVEAWLGSEPDAARRVARYRAQNAGLHALFDGILDEEIPPQIVAAMAGRRSRPVLALALAASLAALVVGAGGGWLAHDLLGGGAAGSPGAPAQVAAGAPPIDTGELMTRAATAHVVNAPEDNVPDAILAAGEDALGAYLSARTGAMVRVPKLSKFGYRLVGGRVLPDTGTAAAQFSFEDPRAMRLTLYVRREKAADGVDITYALAQDLSMFYWNNAGRSYALVADMDDATARKELLQAAEAVYKQLADMPEGNQATPARQPR